jgi:glycosyltransferase involved in cell wall biosynthesis
MTAPGTRAPMTLAVECSRLAHDARGIGRYVRALLPRLASQHAELRILPFARRAAELDALRATIGALALPAGRAAVQRYGDLRADDADLWWYPWNVSRPVPARARVAVTMHDVAPLAYPDPRRAKWWPNRRWRRLYRATAERAELILTVSAFSAGEIERALHVPANRIRITPLGADDLPVPAPERDAEALARLGVRAPYVLAIEANDRRKNLALLDRAMPHVAELLPSVRLVTVGAPRTGVHAGAAWRHPAGFVSDDDLASLYRSARALVVPSLYEGFGLPVLEAMRLGTPVICARAASLPEVGGDAALYVSPTDERQLALAIIQLLTNDALHASMRRAGLERAGRFSWDDTVRRTLDAFDAALGR